MAIEVRKVKHDSDFRQLYNLFVEYEADLPRELRHGTVPDVADLKATYERRNAAFLATSEGDPTGCVALTELDSDTAVVMRLFVKPEEPGARRRPFPRRRGDRICTQTPISSHRSRHE